MCAVLEFVEGDNGSGDDGNACSDEGSGAGEEGKGSASVEGSALLASTARIHSREALAPTRAAEPPLQWTPVLA